MLLDIALGIFTALALGEMCDMQITSFFVMLGIIFSLLPDADFILYGIFNPKKAFSKQSHEHRTLLHYPLLYMPVGTALVGFVSEAWWQSGTLVAVLFAVASFLHFVHDSIGIGFGIPWLYPFSKKNYAFGYRASCKQGETRGKWGLVYAWSPEEVAKEAESHGSDTWFRDIYLSFHPYAMAELALFIISIVTLWLYFS